MSTQSEQDSTPGTPEDLVLVGQIGQPFGIKGWLHIYPYSTEADALLGSNVWWLSKSEQKGKQSWQVANVADVKIHGAGIVVHLVGIDTREQAELLRNTKIAVPRTAFPPAEKDEYYWVDLIGLTVEDSQGKLLGTVVGLLDNGAHSVLQVDVVVTQNAVAEAAEASTTSASNEKMARVGGKKSKTPKKPEPELIPFVDKHVLNVDLAAKKIVVDWEL